MASSTSFYSLLSIPKTSTHEEIVAAYQQWEARAEASRKGWAVLMDVAARKAYVLRESHAQFPLR